MTKYRTLTQEELNAMEKEFINFLVVNGITADDWLKIKASDSEATEKIIASFSDVVFEKILRGVKYLEIYEAKSVRSFKFASEEVVMITMEAESEGTDFRKPEYISNSMKNPPEDLLIYSTTKPYKTTREKEIFNMIEQGCLISKGKLHAALETAI